MRGRRLLFAAVPAVAVLAALAWTTGLVGDAVTSLGGTAPTGPRFPVQEHASALPRDRAVVAFPITDALRDRPATTRPLYRFSPDVAAQDLAARAAAALGLAGRPRQQWDGRTAGSRWALEDGYLALTVDDQPARVLSFADRRPVGAASSSSTSSSLTSSSLPSSSARPDVAAATRVAQALVERLAAVPARGLDWQAVPAGVWGTLLQGRLPDLGPEGPPLWEVSVAPDGRVTSASGPLAALERLGDYPIISVAEAVERLPAAWLPEEQPFLGLPLPYVCVAGARVPVRDPSRPEPTDTPVVVYTDQYAGPPALDDAHVGYAVLEDARCDQYLAPVVRFTEHGTSHRAVLALTDEAIERLPAPVGPTGPMVPATPSGYSTAAPIPEPS